MKVPKNNENAMKNLKTSKGLSTTHNQVYSAETADTPTFSTSKEDLFKAPSSNSKTRPTIDSGSANHTKSTLRQPQNQFSSRNKEMNTSTYAPSTNSKPSKGFFSHQASGQLPPKPRNNQTNHPPSSFDKKQGSNSNSATKKQRENVLNDSLMSGNQNTSSSTHVVRQPPESKQEEDNASSNKPPGKTDTKFQTPSPQKNKGPNALLGYSLPKALKTSAGSKANTKEDTFSRTFTSSSFVKSAEDSERPKTPNKNQEREKSPNQNINAKGILSPNLDLSTVKRPKTTEHSFDRKTVRNKEPISDSISRESKTKSGLKGSNPKAENMNDLSSPQSQKNQNGAWTSPQKILQSLPESFTSRESSNKKPINTSSFKNRSSKSPLGSSNGRGGGYGPGGATTRPAQLDSSFTSALLKKRKETNATRATGNHTNTNGVLNSTNQGNSTNNESFSQKNTGQIDTSYSASTNSF